MIENFGRNIAIEPAYCYQPADHEALRHILQTHRQDRIRCMGALHSWSPIIDTRGVLLDLGAFAFVDLIAGARPRVRVGAGCRLKDLLCALRPLGWTLPTLGAIKAQTVAGAVATGTHGSGQPSLSHFVERLTLAHFDGHGNVRTSVIESGDERLAGRCALGSMGVVLELELGVVPRYRVKESVRKFSTLEKALAGWNDKRWPLTQFALIPWSWTYLAYRRKVSAADGGWLRLRALICRLWLCVSQDIGLHVALLLLLLCARLRRDEGVIRKFFRFLPRLIKVGPRRVDDSVAILTMHHDWFRHVEMELFIPEGRLPEAVAQIRELVEIAGGERDGCSPEFGAALDTVGMRGEVDHLRGTYTLHYPLFFRRIETDDTLVSMASPGRQPAAWISVSFFTYRCRDSQFDHFSAVVGRCMMRLYQARLHWGKYLPSSIPLQDLRAKYSRYGDFERICRRYDPARSFWYG